MIYMDMTATLAGKAVGGIARVCRSLSKIAAERANIEPVFISNDARLFIVGTNQQVDLQPQDIYVIVDAFFYGADQYAKVMREAQLIGAKVALCIHDVIPAKYPAFMIGNLPEQFTYALRLLCKQTDILFSVSKSAAEEINEFLTINDVDRKCQDIKFMRLGGNAVSTESCDVRHQISSLFSKENTFISVGSVMPHKGQFLAITAFEELWTQGYDLNYLIIGKLDRAFCATHDAIKGSASFGKRLFWLDDVDDAELAYVYKHARCLIQPSITEGCGVPLIEALAAGLPVIASDIPVFRENGGGIVEYFSVCDSRDLARKILKMADAPRVLGLHQRQSWDDTLDDLLRVVKE